MASGPTHTASDLAAALERALDDPRRERVEESISDEELALFAEGRLDELGEDSRARVLRAVADDPELADLVADVAEALRGPAESAGAEPGRGSGAPGPRRSTLVWSWVLSAAWASAACLVLALGMWRFADPPAPIHTADDGQLQVYSLDDRAHYWQQLERDRLDRRHRRDRLRDVALIASTATVLVLSIPVAWWAVRGRSGEHNRPRPS